MGVAYAVDFSFDRGWRSLWLEWLLHHFRIIRLFFGICGLSGKIWSLNVVIILNMFLIFIGKRTIMLTSLLAMWLQNVVTSGGIVFQIILGMIFLGINVLYLFLGLFLKWVLVESTDSFVFNFFIFMLFGYATNHKRKIGCQPRLLYCDAFCILYIPWERLFCQMFN